MSDQLQRVAASPTLLHSLQLRLAAQGLDRDIRAGRYNGCDWATLQQTKRLAKFMLDLSEGMAEQDELVRAIDIPAPAATTVFFPPVRSLGLPQIPMRPEWHEGPEYAPPEGAA